jgi:DNA-binding winged helix-turn-helix (wHTH) protein/tetratricopeptide (TPR) repeat protein
LLRFGPFEIDPEDEELRRAGTLVRLARQPFRILLLLIRRAGEVVSREEIHAAIWGNETYVDFEHGTNSAIRQIRSALADNAEQPRYIRTLPRRGYSFIAAVEHVANADEPAVIPIAEPKSEPPRPRRSTVGIAAVAIIVALLAASYRFVQTSATTPSARAIAVEPFRRLGPPIAGVDERTFAEELRATIARLPRAQVSLIDGGGRADYIISGTVRQTEDGSRAIVSIVDAASRTQIWSETFQRPAKRSDGMAVEVAHRVMRELAHRFLPAPHGEPALRTQAPPKVIALYNRARLAHSRSQAYDWMRTKALYEAVLHQEPRFAEAWSGLSDVWIGQALEGPIAACDRAAARALACAQRAVALQPGNAEAHSTLGLLAAQRDYDLATAEDELRRATGSDPQYVDARVNLAMVLAMRGQADDSLREFTIAQQLDPAGLDLSQFEPLLHLYARRYEDARARYRDILAVNPDSVGATWGLMFTYIAQKNWSEALALAATIRPEAIKAVPATEEGFLSVYRGFDLYLQDGRRQAKLNDYYLAIYYAQIHDRDRSFQSLNRAIDVHTPAVSYIMVDPRLDNLHGDPRFRAALARINLGRPPQARDRPPTPTALP